MRNTALGWPHTSICNVGIKDIVGRVNLHPIHSPTPQDFKDFDNFFLSLYISRTKQPILIYPWIAFLLPPPWSFSMSSSLPLASLCVLNICRELHTIFSEIKESGFYLYLLMLKKLIMIKWIILRNLYWNLSPKSFIPSFTYSLSYSIKN